MSTGSSLHVDDRVAHNAIEPGFQTLLIGKLALVLESFGQTVLDNVGCDIWIGYALTNEAGESVKLCQKPLFYMPHGWHGITYLR